MPTFLKKLFEIINEEQQTDIISWSEDGLFFEVKNRTVFTNQVLPAYFKHNNLNSFVRQLNMYDFHKVKRSIDEIKFRHPFFQRDRADLLPKIKRKTNSNYVQALNVQTSKNQEDSFVDGEKHNHSGSSRDHCRLTMSQLKPKASLQKSKQPHLGPEERKQSPYEPSQTMVSGTEGASR